MLCQRTPYDAAVFSRVGVCGNFPADNLNDEAAVAAMHAFFAAGLERLKALAEQR